MIICTKHVRYDIITGIVSFPQSPSRVHIGTYIIIRYRLEEKITISFLVCVMIILVCENVRLFLGLETATGKLAFIDYCT